MNNHINYRFDNTQIANRFINELRHWSPSSGQVQVRAKLAKASFTVQVSYAFEGRGFDYTSSELDELAGKYGGSEV